MTYFLTHYYKSMPDRSMGPTFNFQNTLNFLTETFSGDSSFLTKYFSYLLAVCKFVICS